jgi:hypothetical protein
MDAAPRQLSATQLRELEERGFTTVRAVFSRKLSQRLREVTDRLLGHEQADAVPVPWMHGWDSSVPPGWPSNPAFDSKDPPWNEANLRRLHACGRPCITSGHFRHEIRHPIDDPAMAEAAAATPLLALNAQLLRTPVAQLRLMQQMLVRSDPDTQGRSGSKGQHLDHAFVPRNYAATPMQAWYHSAVALSEVAPGGGGTILMPQSLSAAKVASCGRWSRLCATRCTSLANSASQARVKMASPPTADRQRSRSSGGRAR